MFIRNLDVREAKGTIPMWVIAERLNISETTLRNWMRKEMQEDKRQTVMAAIDEIKAELELYRVSKITKDARPAAV